MNSNFAGTLPVAATEVAKQWDSLYIFLVGLSAFFFVLVMGLVLYFVIRYRSRPGVKAEYITHHVPLEVAWTLVPTILLGVIFVWGYQVYSKMVTAPENAYEIRVIGKQWLWQFQYDDGRTTVGELYVPVNKPVKLLMTSDDVLHDFFIPNFRVKQDVVPGMYTSVWFEARVPGRHQVFCAEYCGTSHSGMLADLIVLEESQWKQWLKGKKPEGLSKASSGLSLVDQGKALTETKGCNACHTSDGSAKIGPSYKGIFGKKVEFVDSTTGVRDENYLKESIENPQGKVVKGFQPVMPTFKGILSEAEINALVAYIKSLKD